MTCLSTSMNMKISVAIVTRNREKFLKECITSLFAQTVPPDELLIIDNNSSDNTKKVTKRLTKKAPFRIRYFLEKHVGYAYGYNSGLENSENNWIIFIDDDCIASPDWLKKYLEEIAKFPKTAAFLGRSRTLYNTNCWSLCSWILTEHWKVKNINNKAILNLEILDNKNIAYRKDFLQKHKLKFRTKITPEWNGAGEDVDLGMRIQKNGGKAIYCHHATVKHFDPNTPDFLWKKFIQANTVQKIVKKDNSHSLSNQKKLHFSTFALKVLYEETHNVFLSFFVICIAFTLIMCERFFSFYQKFYS